MTKNEHNGWYNYETWIIALWMDNEQGSYDRWRAQTRHIVESVTASHARGELGTFTIDERSIIILAYLLNDYHENELPQVNGFAADLINAAMSEVNWMEISKHLIEEVKQEA